MGVFHLILTLPRLVGIQFFGLFVYTGVEVMIEGLSESDERIVKVAQSKPKNIGRKATPALTKALNSKDPLIQSRAANLLLNIGAYAAVLSFSEVMKSEGIFVRLEALSALGLEGQKTKQPSHIL